MQSYGFTDHLKCLYFANNSKLEIVEPGTMDWLIRRHRSEVDISILWNVDFTCALVADRETDGVMDIFSPFWSFMALFGLFLTSFTLSVKSFLPFPLPVPTSFQPQCQDTTISANLPEGVWDSESQNKVFMFGSFYLASGCLLADRRMHIPPWANAILLSHISQSASFP